MDFGVDVEVLLWMEVTIHVFKEHTVQGLRLGPYGFLLAASGNPSLCMMPSLDFQPINHAHGPFGFRL